MLHLFGSLRRCLLLVTAGALLQSCQQPAPPDESAAPVVEFPIPDDAQHFGVVAEASQIIIRVYRAGRLAHLGHNHVVSTQAIKGEAWLTQELHRSGFELFLPVSAFVVDDPALRLQAGDEFSADLDADAIAGTRENMLSGRQLDADAWPNIRVVGRNLRGEWPDVTVELVIEVRSVSHTLNVPLQLQRDGQALRATGEFSVKQTQLGLEPFSVMMGALQVRDQLDISFTIAVEPLGASAGKP